MTTPAKRLKTAREAAGFSSAAEAARSFGWNNSTYYTHENGQRGLKKTAAERYGRAFRVSPAWLLTGEGDPTGEKKRRYERGIISAAIEGLLVGIVPGMDEDQAKAFAEAALSLVDLHQGRNGTPQPDPNKIRIAVAAATKPASTE